MRAVHLIPRNMHAWAVVICIFHSRVRTSLLHTVSVFIALHALRIPTAGLGLVVVDGLHHQGARFCIVRRCVCWNAHVTLSFPETANICLSPAR